jgi:hypothetical protein
MRRQTPFDKLGAGSPLSSEAERLDQGELQPRRSGIGKPGMAVRVVWMFERVP